MRGETINAHFADPVRWITSHFFGQRVLNAAETGSEVDNFWEARFAQKTLKGCRDTCSGCQVDIQHFVVSFAKSWQGGIGNDGDDAGIIDKYCNISLEKQ